MSGSNYFHRNPEKLFPKEHAPFFNHHERRLLAKQMQARLAGKKWTGPDMIGRALADYQPEDTAAYIAKKALQFVRAGVSKVTRVFR